MFKGKCKHAIMLSCVRSCCPLLAKGDVKGRKKKKDFCSCWMEICPCHFLLLLHCPFYPGYTFLSISSSSLQGFVYSYLLHLFLKPELHQTLTTRTENLLFSNLFQEQVRWLSMYKALVGERDKQGPAFRTHTVEGEDHSLTVVL